MKSKAPRAAAGTLCAMLAAAALANDPAPYMGGGKDQALFEAVKDWCWREAAREAGSDEETKKFSLGYADCLDEAFTGKGGVYRAIVRGARGDHLHYTMTGRGQTLLSVTIEGLVSCEGVGAESCTLSHFSRNGCVAYARGGGHHGVGSAASRGEAERVALEHCADSTICTVWSARCPGE